ALVEGTETVTATISNSSNAAVTIATPSATANITDNDIAPIANAVSVSGNEDTLIPVTITGTDDGTVVSFKLSSLPTNGTLYLDSAMTLLATTGTSITATANSLTLYFMPNADWNSHIIDPLTGLPTASPVLPTFSYTATDNQGFVSTPAAATIDVLAVDDGLPVARNDAYTALLGTPIIISKASLMSNDTLPDHATIVSFTNPANGALVDLGNGTYQYTPGSVGSTTFTYTLKDDNGDTSTATTSIQIFNSKDDVATVNESALPNGNGGGVTVATGLLFTNDINNTSLTSVTFNGVTYNTVVGGKITVPDSVSGAHGTLEVVVATGAYTYTLSKVATNGLPASATDTSITDVYSYQGNNSAAALNVRILDDAPTASNQIVNVPLSNPAKYTICVVLDVSGSMVARVDAGGITTRLDMAKVALASLVSAYYEQASDVIVKFITFSTNATAIGSYTTESSAVAALTSPGVVAGGSTNYQSALDMVRTASGLGVTPDNTRQNVVYFLSDGQPTTGTTATGLANYNTYLTANPSVSSYAVAIGTGIADLTNLDPINNVDSLGDGTKDGAIVVPELSQLSSTLLSTIPNAFGGNVLSTAANTQSVTYGADGGYIKTINLMLDRVGADNIPETKVTFTYNKATDQITNDGGLAGFPVSGHLLTVNAASGFVYGELRVDFLTGDYKYFTKGVALAGTQFDMGFTAIDNDGDTASAVQTIVAVNGKPVARDDSDTLFANNTFMDGNVITSLGTDGGSASQIASFAVQGSGVDTIVDNAKITSIDFHGVHVVLGSWTGSVYTAANTGATTGTDNTGVGYSYTVTNGTVTWTASTGGLKLVFDDGGYYKYTPPTAAVPTVSLGANVPVALTSAANVTAGHLTLTAESWGNPTTVSLTSAANAALGNHLTVSGLTAAGSAALAPVYNANGVGVNTTAESAVNQAAINGAETLILDFSAASHPNGVADISITNTAASSNLSNTTGGTPSLTYTLYGSTGNLLGTLTSGIEGGVTMLPYSGVASVHITGSATAVAMINSVSFYDAHTVSTVAYNANGVNVTGGSSANALLDSLETLHINFDHANYANGVQDVIVTVNAANSNLLASAGDAKSLIYTIYATDGHQLAQFSSANEGAINLNTEGLASGTRNLSNIGSIAISANADNTGAATVAAITNISFTPVNTNSSGTAVAPDHVTYTLTDDTTPTHDSSSATLALNVVANSITGTSADDTTVTMASTSGNDYMNGLAGNDTIDGGAGSDILAGDLGNDTLTGGTGDDLLDGGAGDDSLSGGIGSDTLRGSDGNDTLHGDAGNDSLSGDNGNDILFGDANDDILSGGAGNDTLTGGTGSDTFVWKLNDQGVIGAPALDTVTDFNMAELDKLDLSSLLVGEDKSNVANLATFLHFAASGVGNADTTLTVDVNGGAFQNTQTIVLQGVTIQALDGVAAGTPGVTNLDVLTHLLATNQLIVD
ncbi:MAG TPA: type I secretion C-terminal target domain-containing protein, partial [Pseudomonadales bacterium]|nr:type I secretion C-terminal target domain-containing protein [Pseudomonadales bacterium]